MAERPVLPRDVKFTVPFSPALIDSAALQKLLVWLSPAFPIGAYAYSHGLEWAIEDGTVTDASGLQAWIGDILRHGAGRTDAMAENVADPRLKAGGVCHRAVLNRPFQAMAV
ncbi:MAG: hypothetical protein NUV72_01795, partial [Bauldia sp.]|nr:hypothetical protein [Bauldia sp.]